MLTIAHRRSRGRPSSVVFTTVANSDPAFIKNEATGNTVTEIATTDQTAEGTAAH